MTVGDRESNKLLSVSIGGWLILRHWLESLVWLSLLFERCLAESKRSNRTTIKRESS